LLVSITADLGIIGVVPEGFGEAYVNQHISLVRLRQPDVNPRFVGHFLAGRAGQRQFETLNESGAKAGLNLPTIANLHTAKPKKSEQDEIVAIFDALDIRTDKEKSRLRKLRKLRQGLMRDLLTGKIRVTNLLNLGSAAA
jgi:type I restriction enzyme S subunit